MACACACHHVKHSVYHSCLWHFIVFFSQFLNFSSFFGFPPGFAWMAFFSSSMLANSFGARKLVYSWNQLVTLSGGDKATEKVPFFAFLLSASSTTSAFLLVAGFVSAGFLAAAFFGEAALTGSGALTGSSTSSSSLSSAASTS